MPRFVVLEHNWNGVHWDLMLEVDGVLRTWAVDQALVAGVDLPARQLADHRVHYLDYEGPVSGDRGEVRRVDRGRYEVLGWEPDLVRVRLAGHQLECEAELRLIETGTSGSGLSWVLRLGNFD